MPRRQGALAAIPKKSFEMSQARTSIARHLTTLTDMQSVNMVQFRAQTFEEEAVELLAKFMRDPELPQTFRRECALDIVKLARGVVRTWAHAGETIDTSVIGETGNTVDQEIAAARNTAALYEHFTQLVGKGIHPDEWPEDVRQIVGDLVEHYKAPGTIIDQ